MTRTVTRLIVLTLALFGLAAQESIAQIEIKSRAMEVSVNGRVHTQFNSTSVDTVLASEFLIRRARLELGLKINDWIEGRVQPDFGEGDISLKDAYLRLSFDPGFRATLGQFKRPFDLFELTSSTQILVIERAGGVRGVDSCSGPGGICSFSRFTEKLEYSDRDIGVMIDGTPAGGPFRYMLSVTNGTGANDEEENGTKSFSGRVEYEPLEDLVLAANLGLHDYENETTADSEHATAYGGDIEWGNFSQGLHLQAGLVGGDNWQNLDDAGDPSKFLTAQGIASYKIVLEDARLIKAIEPVARLSWGDPDTDANDDEGLLFTPGLVAFFEGRNKIALNVDFWSPSQGDSEYSIKVQSYLHF